MKTRGSFMLNMNKSQQVQDTTLYNQIIHFRCVHHLLLFIQFVRSYCIPTTVGRVVPQFSDSILSNFWFACADIRAQFTLHPVQNGFVCLYRFVRCQACWVAHNGDAEMCNEWTRKDVRKEVMSLLLYIKFKVFYGCDGVNFRKHSSGTWTRLQNEKRYHKIFVCQRFIRIEFSCDRHHQL